MVGDSALSICTTKARARIPTALLHACCRLATLRADQTLRSAVGWCSDHCSLTGANADSVLFFVLTVGSARVRVTWVGLFNNRNSLRDKGTLCNRITGVAIETSADGLVPHGVANSIDPTDSRAGIDALVVDASTFAGTVSVEDTLRPTSQVGVTEVASNARTSTRPLSRSTLSIGSAGSWVAGVDNFDCADSGRGGHNPATVSEGIPGVASRTSAYGLVVLHHTLRVGSTRAGARVDTFFVEASLVAGALRIDGALRPAVGWHSDVVWLTSAGSNLVAFSASGERATRRGAARVDWNRTWRRGSDDHLGALAERIASEARGTLAHRIVVGDLASCIVPTNAWARINALLVDTRCQL